MQRLALAILLAVAILAVAILVLAAVGRMVATVQATASAGRATEGGQMQKIAFALLVGLIVYVAFLGPT